MKKNKINNEIEYIKKQGHLSNINACLDEIIDRKNKNKDDIDNMMCDIYTNTTYIDKFVKHLIMKKSNIEQVIQIGDKQIKLKDIQREILNGIHNNRKQINIDNMRLDISDILEASIAKSKLNLIKKIDAIYSNYLATTSKVKDKQFLTYLTRFFFFSNFLDDENSKLFQYGEGNEKNQFISGGNERKEENHNNIKYVNNDVYNIKDIYEPLADEMKINRKEMIKADKNTLACYNEYKDLKERWFKWKKKKEARIKYKKARNNLINSKSWNNTYLNTYKFTLTNNTLKFYAKKLDEIAGKSYFKEIDKNTMNNDYLYNNDNKLKIEKDDGLRKFADTLIKKNKIERSNKNSTLKKVNNYYRDL